MLESGQALPEVFAPQALTVWLELVHLNNVILDSSYHTRVLRLRHNVYHALLGFIVLRLASLIRMIQ